LANEYLNYTSKDYNSIYADLLKAIPSLTDTWTNTEDGDPGIVLVKLMSILGDMLSYNMDKQALEYYSSTVTQRKNAAKLYKLVGYKMHWYISAINRITVNNIAVVPSNLICVVTYQKYLQATEPMEKVALMQQCLAELNVDNFKTTHPYNEYPQLYTDERNINPDAIMNSTAEGSVYNDYVAWVTEHTINIYAYLGSSDININVCNSNNLTIPYIIKPTTASNVTSDNNYLDAYASIKPGESQDLDVIQGTLNSFIFNSSQLRNNKYYLPEAAVDEKNMWLSYESTFSNSGSTNIVFIDKVDNLLTVTDDSIHFEFNIDEFDNPYIELSSYWASKLGDSVNFTLYYVRTDGVYGNITKNFLDTIEGVPQSLYTITHPANTTVFINSNGELIADSGSHSQTPAQAFKDSLNYITTFDSLITIYDFERFCKRQSCISNTFAVDGQRANDLNNELYEYVGSLSLAQLQAYYDSSTHMQGIDRNNAEEIKNIYTQRKTVVYNENNIKAEYKKYGLNLHVIYNDFGVAMPSDDESEEYSVAVLEPHSINANASNEYNAFWQYKIWPNYQTGGSDEEGRDGWVAYYLDKKLREVKIINVDPEYAYIRVFPWRCCGTIHLNRQVTPQVADSILTTVMDYLREKFSPNNITFGQPINYMDVINTVIESHDMIRYFDAGLGSRKLIDVDESVDISYFNATSMMYYVQTPEGFTKGNMHMLGNNEVYSDREHTTPNPYYQILSIAPEYIQKPY
jgi:hypothetical protein